MTSIAYEVVEHDGGWAYKVGETFSETYPSHTDARMAAAKAAVEHEQSGHSTEIQYQDPAGRWRQEHAKGDDRPQTEVRDTDTDAI